MLSHWLRSARDFCYENGIELPDDVVQFVQALKAAGDITAISAQYHDAITQAITEYFTDVRRRQDANGDFRRATTNAFGDGFETGWIDGGGEMPIDDTDALDWLNARQEQEYGFVNVLFAQMKDLKDEKDFDYFSFATERADGYTATLQSVYNEGKLRAAKNKMLTFDGEDGQKSCATCQKYKGQRHRASFWVAHNLIPYPGNSTFECLSYRCMHGLKDDSGEWFSIGQ